MSEDEFRAFQEMQKMVDRARVMDEISRVIIGLGFAIGVALVIRFFVG